MVCRWTAASTPSPQIITATSTSSATTRSSMVGPSEIRSTSSSAAAAQDADADEDHSVHRGPSTGRGAWGRAGRLVQVVDLGAEGEYDAALEGEDLRAHLVDPRLVPRVEDVKEQRVGGPAGLDDEAAGHQGDHLGDDSQHEVRVGPQVHLDHRVAGCRPS